MTTKQHGKWEVTLRQLRALNERLTKRIERIEKLLAIKHKSTPR